MAEYSVNHGLASSERLKSGNIDFSSRSASNATVAKRTNTLLGLYVLALERSSQEAQDRKIPLPVFLRLAGIIL